MHEVKIYDGEGNLKRTISPKEICEKIDKSFEPAPWKKRYAKTTFQSVPTKCKGCEIIFNPSRTNHVYHSYDCSQKSNREKRRKQNGKS